MEREEVFGERCDLEMMMVMVMILLSTLEIFQISSILSSTSASQKTSPQSSSKTSPWSMNDEDQRWPGGVSNSRKGFMVASNALPAFPYKEEAVFPTCEIIITIITSATQIGFVLNLFINWSPSYLLYRYMMTVKTQWRCWHKVLPWLRCLSVSDVNSRRKEISRW